MPVPHKLIKPAAATPGLKPFPPTWPALPRLGTPPWTDLEVPTSHGRVSVRLGQGAGVPLLLLHGNSADKSVFAGLMRGEHGTLCRMLALDLPGHGASQNARDPGRTYSITGYADMVVEVLEALDLPHVAIVGWSLGGHIALDVAARYPGVLGVVLSGTPPVGNTIEAIMAGFRPTPALALAGQAELSRTDISDFAALTCGAAATVEARAAIARTDGQARALMYGNLLAGEASDQSAYLREAALPIAIINSADDPIVNVEYLQALRCPTLWYRRVHLIEGGGHAPFLTRPEAFGAILKRFIRSMQRRHRTARAHPALCFTG